MAATDWRLPRRARMALAAALAAAWGVSVLSPVAVLTRPGSEAEGVTLLLVGWFGLLAFQPAWLGNLLLWPTLAGLVAKTPRRRTLATLGIVLLVCAGAAALWGDLPDDAGSNPVTAYRYGYWLWLAAVAGAGGAALLVTRRRNAWASR